MAEYDLMTDAGHDEGRKLHSQVNHKIKNSSLYCT